MDQLVFKMEGEPPEMVEESTMFKMEQSNDATLFKMDPSDLDVDFGPQMRIRSNTWPLPRPDNYVDEPSPPNIIKTEDYETLGELGVLLTESKCNGVLSGLPAPGCLTAIKKTATSRRNAWGPSSYADLISQAITSSPEQRLTLSQIYDWMIQNVPYFKDKGDSNSSAGWKVRSGVALTWEDSSHASLSVYHIKQPSGWPADQSPEFIDPVLTEALGPLPLNVFGRKVLIENFAMSFE